MTDDEKPTVRRRLLGQSKQELRQQLNEAKQELADERDRCNHFYQTYRARPGAESVVTLPKRSNRRR